MTAPALRDGARPERMHRLFFALWPTDALRAALEPGIRALQPDGAGRPQRPDQWHLTLEFLGPVPAARLADARVAADAVHAPCCEILLDAVEFWRRPEVLCLVARETPPALVDLVDQLRRALAGRGFQVESRPFRAHLTLARKVHQPVDTAPFAPLHWPVESFALVESVTDRAGSVYTALAHWRIGA
jgi:2'-5' RNA ligase